jgi:hypothetical protein
MSMTALYRRMGPDRLELLLREPADLSEALFPPDDDADVDPEFLDIDKSWHLIHFLLNGDPLDGPWPLGAVVLGGTEISDEDMGYGPARYFTPAQVRELSRALGDVEPESLWSRFDREAVRLAEIYPQAWAGGPDDREYITSNYSALRCFIDAAAKEGQAVVVWLC